jgi:hypothetical protein
MAFNTDGSWYVSDGYANTRVVKFDKNDNYVTAWGERGTNAGPGAKLETRPNYFNNVHGVGVDPQTRQVYVNDRGNRRIQVFDENGKFIRMWQMQAGSSGLDLHFVYLDGDRRVWVFDQVTQQLAQLDREGHLINAWGGLGAWPGALSACTASVWIRKTTSTSPPWAGAACRSSVRARAQIRRTWSAGRSIPRGSESHRTA